MRLQLGSSTFTVLEKKSFKGKIVRAKSESSKENKNKLTFTLPLLTTFGINFSSKRMKHSREKELYMKVVNHK